MLRVALALSLLAASAALARPRVGEPLPSFLGMNLVEEFRSEDDLRGRPTLVVVITRRGASEDMRRWFEEAEVRGPDDLRTVAVASLQVPFFISDDFLRDEARERTARKAWETTFVDGDRNLARQLGLSKSDAPTAIAIGADGRVLAVYEGPPGGAAAERIWQALRATATNSAGREHSPDEVGPARPSPR